MEILISLATHTRWIFVVMNLPPLENLAPSQIIVLLAFHLAIYLHVLVPTQAHHSKKLLINRVDD